MVPPRNIQNQAEVTHGVKVPMKKLHNTVHQLKNKELDGKVPVEVLFKVFKDREYGIELVLDDDGRVKHCFAEHAITSVTENLEELSSSNLAVHVCIRTSSTNRWTDTRNPHLQHSVRTVSHGSNSACSSFWISTFRWISDFGTCSGWKIFQGTPGFQFSALRDRRRWAWAYRIQRSK